MNQAINVVHFVKFTSSGMENVALAVVVFLEQNQEMLRLETKLGNFRFTKVK